MKKDVIRLELKEIQKPIVREMKKNDVTIITGMAGTGKDFMCLHTAIKYIKDKKSGYDGIIITKPIVEVGRSMGFQKGDLAEKVQGYRASFDSITNEILDGSFKLAQTLKDKISFEPINFVRGNTFKNKIVILSEAQNCTIHELVSYVTRLDSSSKLFINGDIFQSDIGKQSGLQDFINILDNIKGTSHLELGDDFQTRNKLIVKLCKNYASFLKNKERR